MAHDAATAGRRRPSRRRWLVAVIFTVGALAACADNQDPGLIDSPGSGADTTSNTLGQCPPGGPDPTTSPAGCIDADGKVQRP